MLDDFSQLLREMNDPKKNARIAATITESDFMPKAGDYFRVRIASIADRSYMGEIWQCIQTQDHCVLCRQVLNTYTGLTGSDIGKVRSFVHGDMIFYNCNELWAAHEAERNRSTDGK